MHQATWVSNAVLVLLSVIFSASLPAAPYQFEAGLARDQITRDIENNGDVKTDITTANLKYFLKPVINSNGPLAERAFLSKSAFISGSFGQSETDANSSTDVLRLNTRFVTQTNFILELEYAERTLELLSLVDSGPGTAPGLTNVGSIDQDSLRIGVGKYLDHRSLAVVSIESTEATGDTTTLAARYRRLLDGAAPNTHIAYSLKLAYTDTDSDSGYEVRGTGFYYFSERLSAGADLSYLDVGQSSINGISLLGRYFFNESISGNAYYALTQTSNDQDSDTIGVGVRARF
ncbi:MAG: hypothetical protein AB8B87_22600 [Granulosicoccus sp.]